jgi:hypothetical protein
VTVENERLRFRVAEPANLSGPVPALV